MSDTPPPARRRPPARLPAQDEGDSGTPALLRTLHALRDLAAVVTALTALLVVVALVLGGVNVVALVLVPLAFLVVALTRPEVLLLLLLVLVTLLVLVSATATLGAVLRAPLLALTRRPAPAESGPAARAPALPPDVSLRRRYVAGELTYTEFRDGMTALLRGRCARGELTLTDYEAALDDLLRPARLLDVRGDPGLAAAPNRPAPGGPEP